ncbi:MAG: RNA 2'-phosphotransferase [Myxococcales bacterium]|nr:RNA 2'-phosphotransferase [Myxococcales bacterium]
MNKKTEIKVSKFLSFALRHRPEEVGNELDEGGWADVPSVLEAAARNGYAVSLEELQQVVANNDKKRFALSDDLGRIRASQGHSVTVELGYTPGEPLELLFHGTVARFLGSIRTQGLLKGQRQHVHLSAQEATARNVGQRRGTPVLLQVRALAMHHDGFAFYLSDNGVWLTETVTPNYIVFPNE